LFLLKIDFLISKRFFRAVFRTFATTYFFLNFTQGQDTDVTDNTVPYGYGRHNAKQLITPIALKNVTFREAQLKELCYSRQNVVSSWRCVKPKKRAKKNRQNVGLEGIRLVCQCSS